MMPGRAVQQIRGMKDAPPRDRVKPYSAESYSAQYGITVEDAEELRETCKTHAEIEKSIFSMYAKDAELKKRCLIAEENVTLTQEEMRLRDSVIEGLRKRQSSSRR